MRRLAVLGGVLLIAIVVVYGGGVMFGIGPDRDGENWPVRFQSNGERIYFTATSSSGRSIMPRGGGMQMHRGSCATCHGADRQGRRLMPRFWKVAPPLTPAALFDEHDETSKENGHGGHEGYDDATLRRAITEGIDPGGNSLDREMPRWSMAARDIADLIEFLKSPVRDSRSSSP